MAHEVDNNLSSTGFIFNKRIDLSQELNNKINYEAAADEIQNNFKNLVC